jgi:hypothetical protein
MSVSQLNVKWYFLSSSSLWKRKGVVWLCSHNMIRDNITDWDGVINSSIHATVCLHASVYWKPYWKCTSCFLVHQFSKMCCVSDLKCIGEFFPLFLTLIICFSKTKSSSTRWKDGTTFSRLRLVGTGQKIKNNSIQSDWEMPLLGWLGMIYWLIQITFPCQST